jgi:hypothetical protein
VVPGRGVLVAAAGSEVDMEAAVGNVLNSVADAVRNPFDDEVRKSDDGEAGVDSALKPPIDIDESPSVRDTKSASIVFVGPHNI